MMRADTFAGEKWRKCALEVLYSIAIVHGFVLLVLA
jgi:hypothetical protein